MLDMAIEIERKFLVKNLDFKTDAFKKTYVKQGYLNSDRVNTVRVRITNEKGFITVKGKTNSSGTTRFEWEKEIPKSEAEQLLILSKTPLVEKTRYYIKNDNLCFEVDEFHGENQGLFLAEIELEDENQSFTKPDWLGKEVTGNFKYYNSYLSENPFSTW